MNSLKRWLVLLALVFGLVGSAPPAQAQNEKPASEVAQAASTTASKAEAEELREELAAQRQAIERLQTLVEQLAGVKSLAPASATGGARLVNASLTASTAAAEVAASTTASKAEVEELREDLAAQRQAIERLQTLVEQLAGVKSLAPAPATGGARLVNASLTAPMAAAEVAADPEPLAAVKSLAPTPAATDGARLVNASLTAPMATAEVDADPEPLQKPPEKKESAALPVAAGWNGEHFFIKSADGVFQVQPYGYVQTAYFAYEGDGAPPNTFAVRKARFGFQGNYGDHFQFGMLIDAAATSGSTIRDIYLNAKWNNAFQLQAGQFKEPFAQEELAGDTNLDFIDRGLQSLLYPSAATSYRSPGAVIHGDIKGGVFQYWAGAFNGKGYSTNNTTSVPEAVGRLRFYPWRNKKGSALHDFAFGASVAHSDSRGLSGETTAPMTMPDSAYTWFPQFAVNGGVWRYEGEFTYLKGRWGFRDEYVQAIYDRTGVGTLTLGGLGFGNLPAVRFRAWGSTATYLFTKERRPENGTPLVRHPLFGLGTPGSRARGWGAWELAVRYSGIQGKEPGIFFNNIYTPQLVPAYDMHSDQFSFGVNWYPNYWMRFQSSVDIDRLKDPSTIGAVPQNYFVWEEQLQYRF
jgi:phosphate-selective porin